MTLQVFTACIGIVDPDVVNITREGGTGFTFAPSKRLETALAEQATDRDWLNCSALYIEEMRGSYRLEKQAWLNLLALERVVLTCACVDPTRCHRTVLAQQILPKFDAAYRGEIS